MTPVSRIGALIIGDEILSGKRADKHLAHVIATLSARGLTLAWARYEGDDRARLTAVPAIRGAGLHPNREVWVRQPREAARSGFVPTNKHRPETTKAF